MNTQTHVGERRRSLWKSPALITALILLIPLLGNHFVEGWNWELRAFVLFGTIIFGIGLTYQLVTMNVDTLAYRAAVGIALAAGFLLFWGNFVQAADDVNPAAMMYFLALPVGIIGAVIARFRPDGMARALFATALAQALVLAIVLMRNLPVTAWTAAVWRGFGANAFFVVLVVGSAWLFQKAAPRESAPVAV
jgi:hypothetical protein